MLTSGEQEKDVNTTSLIENWLAERNELLVLFCRLSGKRKEQVLPDGEQINQFCDVLVDYVSAGHFEVYEQIVSACDTNGQESLSLLEQLVPKISLTTDIVVDFNDKYSSIKSDDSFEQLDSDLSRLGEAIAHRVELEDELIDTLTSKH
ncbi:sigma D regulator [Pleionea sp. CnH1-48]|uniref:sigma D regulator n=1 Tax=Pleionea sp. CnH1-48 TaxID=2954494 RepID=UPI002098015B|nr:sigma D regulator [Pleionea sp. CnH1-48]MCO7226213.1 sigma D regulator [Pleionea sp. CnH1-48]